MPGWWPTTWPRRPRTCAGTGPPGARPPGRWTPALPATTLREAVVSLATPGHARVVALALARSRATANATAQLQSVDLAPKLAEARAALHQAEQTRADLLAGRGAYLGTEAGQAVADLARAEAGLAAARREAEHGSHWWARRAAAKEADAWAERHADARRALARPRRPRSRPPRRRHRCSAGDELARLNASVDRQAARSAAVTDQRQVDPRHRRRSRRPSRTVPAPPGQPRTATSGACCPIGLPTFPGSHRLPCASPPP